MKVKTVAFRRIKNLGNYENEALEVEIELEDGDTVARAASVARDIVDGNLYGDKAKLARVPKGM